MLDEYIDKLSAEENTKKTKERKLTVDDRKQCKSNILNWLHSIPSESVLSKYKPGNGELKINIPANIDCTAKVYETSGWRDLDIYSDKYDHVFTISRQKSGRSFMDILMSRDGKFNSFITNT